MFFVDGEKLPSVNGTGTEDYFLGAYDFGGKPFSYALYGAPVVGEEKAGSRRCSVYRFHLDSPISFTKSLKATIEHGHANGRSDNYFSVAYWYQTEPPCGFSLYRRRWKSACPGCIQSADRGTRRSRRSSFGDPRYPVPTRAFSISIAPSCAWRSISLVSSASVNLSFHGVQRVVKLLHITRSD